jgi:hypothetical protein
MSLGRGLTQAIIVCAKRYAVDLEELAVINLVHSFPSLKP